MAHALTLRVALVAAGLALVVQLPVLAWHRTPRALGGCSAAGLSARLPVQPALPRGVAAMRLAIARAAVRCDFAALQALTVRGSQTFTFQFGETTDPGTFWQHEEAVDHHPLRAMVKLLGMPYTRLGDGLQYIWPSAFQDHPREPDFAALGTLYTRDAIAHFRQVGYLGYRLGISPTGEWLYFVQGD